MQKLAAIGLAALAGALLVYQISSVLYPDYPVPPEPAPVVPPEPAPKPPRPSPMPDHFEFGKVNRGTAGDLEQLADTDLPLLVKFGAEWCGPCQRLAPELEQFAKDAGSDVLVIELELTEDKAPFDAWGISTMPTLVAVRHGQELKRISGVLSARNIAKFVGNAIDAN